MSFELRHLRYVLAAAEHRSFFRAALALDIEQSSMSRAILRLERRLGVKLFRRSHAGVSPTSAGAEFIRAARYILAKSEQLVSAMRVAGNRKAGQLRIGTGHSVPIKQLEAILLTWRQLSPEVRVDKVAGSQELLIAGLDAQVIDIAILAGDRSFAGIHGAPLWAGALMQRKVDFSGYWRSDNDNPALREFLEFVHERHALKIVLG